MGINQINAVFDLEYDNCVRDFNYDRIAKYKMVLWRMHNYMNCLQILATFLPFRLPLQNPWLLLYWLPRNSCLPQPPTNTAAPFLLTTATNLTQSRENRSSPFFNFIWNNCDSLETTAHFKSGSTTSNWSNQFDNGELHLRLHHFRRLPHHLLLHHSEFKTTRTWELIKKKFMTKNQKRKQARRKRHGNSNKPQDDDGLRRRLKLSQG